MADYQHPRPSRVCENLHLSRRARAAHAKLVLAQRLIDIALDELDEDRIDVALEGLTGIALLVVAARERLEPSTPPDAVPS